MIYPAATAAFGILNWFEPIFAYGALTTVGREPVEWDSEVTVDMNLPESVTSINHSCITIVAV